MKIIVIRLCLLFLNREQGCSVSVFGDLKGDGEAKVVCIL